MDAHPTCPPTLISFKDLFLTQEEDEEETASLADMLTILAAKWPDGALFESADVAKLANSTGEWAAEREAATSLREILFPNIPVQLAVTAKGTGKRLKRHVDEPVPCNGYILSLKESRDPIKRPCNFMSPANMPNERLRYLRVCGVCFSAATVRKRNSGVPTGPEPGIMILKLISAQRNTAKAANSGIQGGAVHFVAGSLCTGVPAISCRSRHWNNGCAFR